MALRLTGISKRYGDQQVLDGVSMHVRAGDCYGFLGHNGAGKTTAMRIALGLVRPDAGRVLVDGFDAAEHPLEARARMGALIEVPGFHAQLSGKRNLVLLAGLQGMRGAAAEAEADRVLEAVGLAGAARKAAGAYSQGMRQRLGIAQAILGRPKVVLLDEPTNGLDPEGIEEIRRLLRRLTRDEGGTVLLSSHQLHELSGVCNRIAILRQGRLLVEDETSNLLAARAGLHVLRTGDDDAAAAVLGSLGVPHRRSDDAIEANLSGRSAGDVAKALVAAGVEIRSLAPRPASLEEIYLDFTRAGAVGAASGGVPATSPHPEPESPRERVAASGPVRRTAVYDARRWTSDAAVPLAFLAPAGAAILGVFSFHSKFQASADAVASGRITTTTRLTAFAATGYALEWAVPLLAFVAASAAALSIAGEFGSGTLRNVILRPVGRARMTLGKAAAGIGAALAAYVVVVAAAMGLAALLFDFSDLVELLETGQLFPLEGYAAKDLWPVTRDCLLRQAPVVAAFAAVGAAVGAWARSGAIAIVGVAGVCAALVIGAGFGGGPWFPTWYVPLLSRAAPAAYLSDFAMGTSNVAPLDARAVWVPLAWAAAAVGAACWKMKRRSIP